jgi:hypothetical protein
VLADCAAPWLIDDAMTLLVGDLDEPLPAWSYAGVASSVAAA